MIEQQGQVVNIDANRVYVRVGSRANCPNCEAGKGCGGGIFSKLITTKPVTLAVPLSVNSPSVNVGQLVLLGLPDAVFLRWTATLFALPLILGLLTAGLSQWILSSWWPQLTTALSDGIVLSSVIFIAYFSIRMYRQGAADKIDATQMLQILKVIQDTSCKAGV